MIVSAIAESLRGLRRRPGPAFATIVALAFAIGLFAAIVSVLQGFLFRPSIVRDVDRIVRVRERVGASGGQGEFSVSPKVFDAWRASQTVFEDMAAATAQSVAVEGSDGAGDSLPAALVTANFFHVLGISPQLGRDFASGEDVGGRDGEVLLSDDSWRNRFNSDAGILGRLLRIDGREYRVIGVMPPHLSHPYAAQLWLPFRWDEVSRQQGGNFLYVPARLRDGISTATAQSALGALAASIHQARPDLGPTDAASLSPLREEMLGDLRPTLWLLFAGACFVLLIAVLNTATMFYAQGLADARATVVRLALGASRSALFRRAAVRSSVVVGAATALALVAASRLYEPLLKLSGNASIREFDHMARLDLPTLCWIVAAAMVVVLTLASLDVRHTFSAAPSIGLGVRGASVDRRMRARLAAATVAQCALAFVVAATGLLVVLGYQHLRTMNRGFSSDNVVVADLAFPLSRYPTPASRDALIGRLSDALRALPGTSAVAGSTVTPDYDGDWSQSFVIPGQAPPPDPGYEFTNHRLVTPGYFAALQITMLAGRDFDRDNPTRDSRSAIVSRHFAQHAWPNASAIGQLVNRVDSEGRVVASLTVIGVVDDVVEAVRDPLAPAQRSWYLSTSAGSDYDYSAISLVVRSTSAPAQLAAGMRSALARIDSELAWSHLSPMRERLAQTVERERLSGFLFALFAACSLLIACAGVYGALAFVVETSRREFGIKLALGARIRQILVGILLLCLRQVGLGLVLGAAFAFPLSRWIGDHFAGVTAGDAWTLAPLALAVLALALCTGYFAARRAASVDPIEALRYE